MTCMIKLGISARHVHLSHSDMDILFGAGSQLHKIRDLGQPGEFPSEEKVDLATEKATLKGVRIIGPLRKQTQVELAMTDARSLGLTPPLRVSGNLQNSCGIKIIGPAGTVDIHEGVIIVQRHIHLDLKTAAEFGLNDKDIVKVKIPGERALIFDEVSVRVKDTYAPEFHIDTDEGNASYAVNNQMVEIIK